MDLITALICLESKSTTLSSYVASAIRSGSDRAKPPNYGDADFGVYPLFQHVLQIFMDFRLGDFAGESRCIRVYECSSKQSHFLPAQ